jgi:TolA-binding protein
MKTAQRHQLKSNEVAEQLARASEFVAGRSTQLAWAVGAVIGVAILIGGIVAWRQGTQERAGAALAAAMSVAHAQVIPPGSGKLPEPNSFSSESARADAAVQKYREVIQQFPSTSEAMTARFEAAALLTSVGKTQEAEQYFREVMSGDSGIHGRMARMALAELQVRSGKYDDAISTYRDLAARKDDDLPVDAVLMQLGRAYELAGKRAEAVQTYQRILNEFANSIYVGEARKAADALKINTVS